MIGSHVSLVLVLAFFLTMREAVGGIRVNANRLGTNEDNLFQLIVQDNLFDTHLATSRISNFPLYGHLFIEYARNSSSAL